MNPQERRAIMLTDKQLQQAVLTELNWEPAVTASHIGVAAKNGVVTLSGHVPTYWEKRAAEKAAGRVKGVKAVVEEIEVRLVGSSVPADDELAERAVQSLESDVSVPRDRIKIKVEKGRVTLTGEVDWHYQKRAAEYAVQRLFGVVGLTNRIAIKPSVAAYDVREKIAATLARTAAFDAAGLSIETDGGKVTLSGNVSSWHERNLVENAAWAVPGVSQVSDKISVNW
jgi:osmotically-inducible protein OsmY